MGSHRADRRGLRRQPPAAGNVPPSLAVTNAGAPGRRKASKHSGPRGPLFRGLPSMPVLLGVAAMAVSAGGAVTAANPDLLDSNETPTRILAASALNGSTSQSTSDLLEGRGETLSRDSRRDKLAEAAQSDRVEEAEALAEQRNAALARFAAQAEAQAKRIERNQWVLPVSPSITTAVFGQYGLWASYHTGLDFNGSEGQEIMAVANGVVTSVGYDGSYGNKTVITLEDGTEHWYAHQSSYAVSEGDVVRAGEVIGYIGSTGNVTGSHLHFEVRPGGGDPVDPYAAFVVHGLTP